MLKRGLSPIIATVLLLAITVVLAAVIFTFSKSTLDSFSPPINCQGISFEAGIVQDPLSDQQNILEIDNQGQDLAGVVIKVYDSATGSIDTVRVDAEIFSGQSEQIQIELSLSPREDSGFSTYEFLIVPLVRKGGKTAVCTDESGVPATIQVISPASGGDDEGDSEEDSGGK